MSVVDAVEFAAVQLAAARQDKHCFAAITVGSGCLGVIGCRMCVSMSASLVK